MCKQIAIFYIIEVYLGEGVYGGGYIWEREYVGEGVYGGGYMY